MHEQTSPQTQPAHSILYRTTRAATLGTALTWGVYYLNAKYQILAPLHMGPTLYNWTVGGLPEFFGALTATTIPAQITDSFYAYCKTHNHNLKKSYEPLVIGAVTGGLAAMAGTMDEVYNFSGGTSDEWDIARYCAGFGLGLAASLFRKRAADSTPAQNSHALEAMVQPTEVINSEGSPSRPQSRTNQA